MGRVLGPGRYTLFSLSVAHFEYFTSFRVLATLLGGVILFENHLFVLINTSLHHFPLTPLSTSDLEVFDITKRFASMATPKKRKAGDGDATTGPLDNEAKQGKRRL